MRFLVLPRICVVLIDEQHSFYFLFFITNMGTSFQICLLPVGNRNEVNGDVTDSIHRYSVTA